MGIIKDDVVPGKFLETLATVVEVTECFGSVNEYAPLRADGKIIGEDSVKGSGKAVPAPTRRPEHRVIHELCYPTHSVSGTAQHRGRDVTDVQKVQLWADASTLWDTRI